MKHKIKSGIPHTRQLDAIPPDCGVLRFIRNLEKYTRLKPNDAANISEFVGLCLKERMLNCCHKDCYTDKVYYFVRGYQFEYKPAPWDVAPCYSDLIHAKGRDYAVLQQKFKKVAEKALQRSDKVI